MSIQLRTTPCAPSARSPANDSIAQLRTLMSLPTLEGIFSQLAVEQDTPAIDFPHSNKAVDREAPGVQPGRAQLDAARDPRVDQFLRIQEAAHRVDPAERELLVRGETAPDVLARVNFHAILDGELVVKDGDAIASFNNLQQRLNRKTPEPKLIAKYPGHIIVYDALAVEGAYAAAPAAELVAALAGNVHNPWQPPGGGLEGALSHDVIHGLDITVPLATGRRVPEPHLLTVLDFLTGRGGGTVFGTDLTGVELRADDLDWSYGSGAPVTGGGQHLLLAMAGRRLPAGLLCGSQAARFS